MNQTPEDVIADLARDVQQAAEGDHLSFSVTDIGSAVIDLLGRIPVSKHPLGFYHYELTELISVDNQRMRLHIWTVESLANQDDVGTHHAHTWELRSCVLTGSLRDTRYEATKSSDGEFVETENDYVKSRLLPSRSRYSLKPVRTIDIPSGFVYCLEDGVPHSTEITSIPAATLVLARESGRTRTPIYSRGAQPTARPAVRASLGADEAERAVAQALLREDA